MDGMGYLKENLAKFTHTFVPVFFDSPKMGNLIDPCTIIVETL